MTTDRHDRYDVLAAELSRLVEPDEETLRARREATARARAARWARRAARAAALEEAERHAARNDTGVTTRP